MIRLGHDQIPRHSRTSLLTAKIEGSNQAYGIRMIMTGTDHATARASRLTKCLCGIGVVRLFPRKAIAAGVVTGVFVRLVRLHT